MGAAERIEIMVSADKMEADAYIQCKEGEPPVTVEDLRSAVAQAGIVAGVVNDERILGYLETAGHDDVQFTIALGAPPGQGKDATITYDFAGAKNKEAAEGDGNVDLKEITGVEVHSVQKGRVIAWKKPATRGSDGVTVLGDVIAGEWGLDEKIKCGLNVSSNEDGTEFTAEADGSPVLQKNTLRIDPIYIVNGDVDSATGNVTFAGSVHVTGNVTDGFGVKADGNVLISGTLMASNVVSGGDIEVKGGIITREVGSVISSGGIKAKFIENSTVEAGGDIIVDRAIINSRINSNGSVLVFSNEGTIMGGEISAYGEIVAKTLGSSTGSRTTLRVGTRFDGARDVTELENTLADTSKKLEMLKKSIAVLSAQGDEAEKVEKAKVAALELEKQRRDLQVRINGLKKNLAPNRRARVRGEQIINEGCSIFVGSSRIQITVPLKFSTLYEGASGGVAITSYDEKTGKIISSGITGKSTKLKVLICDDAKFMRIKLKDILEHEGYRVVGEAEDGLQAVDKAKQLRPDIITMDITMPNMDGIAALTEIKKQNPKQTVIMISALGQVDKVRTCIIAGAADFIVKPFDPEKVRNTLNQVLARK